MNEIKERAQTYTKGAIIGGVVSGIFALVTKRRFIVWAGLGALAGGYIAYKFSDTKKDSTTKTGFRNLDLENDGKTK